MKNYSYKTKGTCAREINFAIEDGKLHDVHFVGGCPGNTLALGKLLEDTDAQRAVDILNGNPCDQRGTSCADQLAQAVEQALAQEGQ